jgi:hypothetical protein
MGYLAKVHEKPTCLESQQSIIIANYRNVIRLDMNRKKVPPVRTRRLKNRLVPDDNHHQMTSLSAAQNSKHRGLFNSGGPSDQLTHYFTCLKSVTRTKISISLPAVVGDIDRHNRRTTTMLGMRSLMIIVQMSSE